MTANITIYTKELSNVLLISARALSFQPDSVLQKKYIIQGTVQQPRVKGAQCTQANGPLRQAAKLIMILQRKLLCGLKKIAAL